MGQLVQAESFLEKLKNKEPTRCHLLFYCAELCSSLQHGHYFRLTAPNIQPTANQEQNDQCGNQQHSRELLMMGKVMPETC